MEIESDGGKIFPRNLTARAAHRVVGNPDVTRPEDSASNCYPGLDIDLRNLDRRFFPGLVFEFVGRRDASAPYSEPGRYGALLAYVDQWGDPDLQPEYLLQLSEEIKQAIEKLSTDLLQTLRGAQGNALRRGEWYLDWVEQGGNRITMNRLDTSPPTPLDGLFVWRLIRGLEPGPVSIGLIRRDTSARIVLNGWRRSFTHPGTGVLSAAYQPGELLQSLCSPWQHDLRDCSCHYWAANRPDVVFGAVDLGYGVQHANMLIDWMRAERSSARSGAASKDMPVNRRYQMDHFEINHTWQQLNVVIDSTEIGAVYALDEPELAEPYDSPDEFAKALREELAPLEMTVAVEYLYARFSLCSPDSVGTKWKTLRDDVLLARHYLMLIAISEMQHLRWANEMLWTLFQYRLIPNYEPILEPSEHVPTSLGKCRPRALRRLEPTTLSDLAAGEQPGGALDRAYARTVSTLKDKLYPGQLGELAGRILGDGVQHHSRLRYIESVLQAYQAAEPRYPYLRPLKPGTEIQADAALDQYAVIKDSLRSAFHAMAVRRLGTAAKYIDAARAAMTRLLDEGEKLAHAGIGVPFWPEP